MTENTTIDLTWSGLMPTSTPETAPFWDACNRGVFLLQKCNACGKFQYHYRAHCCHCMSTDIADYESTGKGTVWTFSTVYKNANLGKGHGPYVVGMVELEGGTRVFGNILGIDPEEVHIGLPVEVAFSKSENGQHIPVFVAAAS
jgi:uncharacterized OB-fold protein